MKSENYVDLLLQKIDRQNIEHLLAEECTPKEISDELGISEKYVEDILEENQFRQERWSEVEHND